MVLAFKRDFNIVNQSKILNIVLLSVKLRLA